VEKAERIILDMVENGQVSAEEGLRLINAMNSSKVADAMPDNETQEEASSAAFSAVSSEEATDAPQLSEEEQQRMNRLKRWWVLPFGIGLLITTLGAIWMYSGYQARPFGFGFWLALLPFLLGIFIMAVSFQTSRSVWLHVRIKQQPGETPQRISISMPVPIALTRWLISAFGNRIPGLKDQPLENYSEILESLSPEDPFYIHVKEDDGEEVEVFIG